MDIDAIVQRTFSFLFTNYNATLVVTLGTFLIHELSYFGFAVPYYIADYMPSMQQYKIQKDKPNTNGPQIRCFKKVIMLHTLAQVPMMVMAHAVFTFCGMTHEGPIPKWYVSNMAIANVDGVGDVSDHSAVAVISNTISIGPLLNVYRSTIASQVVVFFLIEDFYFYWIHRLLHYGWFYKNIHKIHHEHAAPFGIAAEYAHPAETFFLGIGTGLGPIIVGLFTGTHLFTIWLWVVIRLWQTIDVHSGYDFPWSPNRYIPLWGGAEFHDYHHMAFIGNYASTFTYCDKIFGTDDKYQAWKKKQSTKVQ